MSNDLFLVKVDDIEKYSKSRLGSFLDERGFALRNSEPNRDCPWVLVDLTEKVCDLGYPEMLQGTHCVGECIMEDGDFIDIFGILTKYKELPSMTYDRDKAILEEIEKRIAEEDNEDEEEQVEADELVPFEDIAMLFACTDSVDIDISIQRSIDGKKLQYLIEIEDSSSDSVCFNATHSEDISLVNIASLFNKIDRLIEGQEEETYAGIGWGRIEFLFMNTRSMTIIFNMVERDQYDGTGDYMIFNLSENYLYQFRDFLKRAYIALKE